MSGDRQPNILFIITDQLHIDAMSAAGCADVNTPAIDSLCASGVRFAQSHCAYPVCGPSRSSLFSGRMPSELRTSTNGKGIPRSVPNMGQWFREHTDYETVYAGKWHLPTSGTFNISGFHVLTGGDGRQGDIGDRVVSRACERFLRERAGGRMERAVREASGQEGDRSLERTAESGSGREAERPFLLVASFLQPHDICAWIRMHEHRMNEPLYPEIQDELPELPNNFTFAVKEPEIAKDVRHYSRAPHYANWSVDNWQYYMWSYYREVEMVDAYIGNVLAALQESGYGDNTLVVFTSDHGEGLARHQSILKSSPYDEAIKVPLIVSFPGRWEGGRVDEKHLVSGVDLLPTLCDFAGIEAPLGVVGASLRPLLEADGAVSGAEEGAVVPWRSFVGVETSGDKGRVIRSEKYKYVKYVNDSVEMLYDMEGDPQETRNLAEEDDYADILEAHREMLEAWDGRLTVVAG
jgi:choline-sulfatase